MSSDKLPVTPAIRFLKQKDIKYDGHLYDYQDKGGTKVSSHELGVNEHSVIKTLIMEDENKKPIIILMHGDLEVSTKNLARFLNTKQINPCTPDIAEKHTGYQVGGTSPFGTKKTLQVYVEKSILDLDKIYINGGKRGFLISIDPMVIVKLLNAVPVEVGIKK